MKRSVTSFPVFPLQADTAISPMDFSATIPLFILFLFRQYFFFSRFEYLKNAVGPNPNAEERTR
jgi:hypothetical protein